MRVSVIAPLKNEAPWVGYSVMAALPGIHEFIYAVDPKSDDGSVELLQDLQKDLGKDKLKLLIDDEFSFNPMDTLAYNQSFDACMEEITGDAVYFLHPDMLVRNPEMLLSMGSGPLAWWTNVTSYAGDFQTVITKGRGTRWKNIHMNQFGLMYRGGYGSNNEDFYHQEITGDALRHYGSDFKRYPFQVRDSGLLVDHYCEMKSYKRRFEKMKLCIKTQYPAINDSFVEEMATVHPRVHLQSGPSKFGEFQFTKTDAKLPEVVQKYQSKFEAYTKELVHHV